MFSHLFVQYSICRWLHAATGRTTRPTSSRLCQFFGMATPAHPPTCCCTQWNFPSVFQTVQCIETPLGHSSSPNLAMVSAHQHRNGIQQVPHWPLVSLPPLPDSVAHINPALTIMSHARVLHLTPRPDYQPQSTENYRFLFPPPAPHPLPIPCCFCTLTTGLWTPPQWPS